MHKLNRFLACDIETTGLDPMIDLVLEVALVVTDENFNELAARSWVVRRELWQLDVVMGDYVRKMHTKSGLLDDLPFGLSMEQVRGEMLEFASTHKCGGGPIVGSSPHFDASILRQEFPDAEFKELWNHRVYDCSTLKQCLAQWGYNLKKDEPQHRALDDVRYSLKLARAFDRYHYGDGPAVREFCE